MTPPQPPSGPSSPSRVEQYPHGYRLIQRTLPDGNVEWDRVPLTVEDVLHPQENDEIPVRGIHELDCGYLTNIFRSRPLEPSLSYVTADWLTDWGVPELRNTSPDVAVFVGMNQQPDLERGTFSLPELGGWCVLAVEVVSPDRRINDVVHKLREYHIVGIPLYVIIDQEKEGGPRKVLAYRHASEQYEPIALDAKGRVYLEPLGLYLGMHDNRVACYDAATGRELGDYSKLAQKLEAADRRIQEQARDLEAADRLIQENEQVIEDNILQTREARRAQRIAEERIREEIQAREDAQRLAREEAKTREEAQRLAREEAKAREDAQRLASEATQSREEAQRLAREEAKAREDAQRLARRETRAREEAEQKVQELLATLQRLQGGASE